MNKWIGIGRLVRDNKLEYSQGGTAFLRNALAVNRFGEKDKADFVNLTFFKAKAEALDKYTKKGSKIAVMGRIQVDTYTDKNGNKQTSFSIIVDEWEFAESKNDNVEKPGNDFLNVTVTEELPFE